MKKNEFLSELEQYLGKPISDLEYDQWEADFKSWNDDVDSEELEGYYLINQQLEFMEFQLDEPEELIEEMED